MQQRATPLWKQRGGCGSSCQLSAIGGQHRGRDTACIVHPALQVSLDDYKGKYVILFFYPKDFT